MFKINAKRILKKIYNIGFNSSGYWKRRYVNGGNSGDGSYNEKAKYKAKILNSLIEEYRIKEILEFGCGDGNNLKYFDIEKYIGLDISKKAVELCINTYSDDINKTFFYYEPFLFKSGGLKVKMTMSLEVIFHLIEDKVFKKYMYDLFNTSEKYVLIFSSNHNNNKKSAIHVKHREFIKDVPDNFKLIKKIETPIVGDKKLLFSDFYLFKKLK